MTHDSRFPAWAWWIIGAITILAVSILIFSVVLGIRAGQQQIEVQRRQQIGISLQRATDLQADGELQAALDEYQKVLLLDPSNEIAQQGIKNLLALAAAGTPVASEQVSAGQTSDAAPAATHASTSPLSVPAAATRDAVVAAGQASPTETPQSTLDIYWENAQTAIKAGRWQEALNNLTILQQLDGNYKTKDVRDQLFTAYVNLALEKDNIDNLEEALLLYDKALALRPTAADIHRERDLIDMYLEVLTYSDVDWERTLPVLEEIYSEEPDYRDVGERLQEAYSAYARQLAEAGKWCSAYDQYKAALSLATSPELIQQRDDAETQCSLVGDAGPGATPVTARATITGDVTAAGELATDVEPINGEGPAGGRIYYSSVDTVTGKNQIMMLNLAKNTPAQLVVEEGAQPAMRGDGMRLAFRNVRRDMAGLSSYDPGTGLLLRFSQYAEDSLPSWNPLDNRIVFASNREGDRRWRIYTMWADVNGATDTLGYGQSPAWHPTADQIVFRGCDESGNRCGLWTMSGSGTSAAPLTNVPADDRPRWSPAGDFVVFMSNGRDGNVEIYRVDTVTREITRLTDNSAIDALPVVSPDGQWVAFVSNRDGSWKLYAVPSDGGPVQLIGPVAGDLGDYAQQGLEWTN